MSSVFDVKTATDWLNGVGISDELKLILAVGTIFGVIFNRVPLRQAIYGSLISAVDNGILDEFGENAGAYRRLFVGGRRKNISKHLEQEYVRSMLALLTDEEFIFRAAKGLERQLETRSERWNIRNEKKLLKELFVVSESARDELNKEI